MRLNEIFSSRAIATRWNENINNTMPDLGEAFFPVKRILTTTASWYEGSTGIANSLMPSALDAEMTYRQREGLKKIEVELPFFREAFRIGEKDAAAIEDASNSNDPNAAVAIDKVFNDSQNLIRGAQTAIERTRMSLLFPENGNLGANISANGVKYDYAYDPSGKWKESNYLALTGGDAWTAADTADPIQTVIKAKQAIMDKTGADIKYAIMNTVTFNLMAKTAAVKNRFLSTAGITVGYIVPAEAKSLIEKTTNTTIIIHDKQYKNESGVSKKYVPDNYVSFLPEGALGNTLVGRTPEERRIKDNTLDVSIVSNGIVIASFETPHPVAYNILASVAAIPSFERKNDMFTVKVA